MTTTLISYSWTGNNDALATRLAAGLGARHIRITEPKPRTNLTVTLDLLFRRTPRIALSDEVDADALLVFVAPVWMGQVAFPLRRCLRDLKGRAGRYAFISLSGGGDGPDSNPNLARELETRAGTRPLTVINLHTADLVASESKPTPQEISNYRVSDGDLTRLTDTALATLRQALPAD